ncbi:MAG: hypothetical protein ACI8W8_004986, partial [Rhodothermales bacterium]
MHRLRLTTLLALSVLCSAFATFGTERREAELKTAYLLNFLRYAEFPEGSFKDKSSPLVIVVLGESPFGEELLAKLAARECRGRNVIVRKSMQADNLTDAHLVFISGTNSSREQERLI